VDQNFNIEDFSYPLTQDRIAKYPLAERSKSKLLLWKKGSISHKIFENVPALLPSGSLMVFNDTKVIAARLLFHKPSGAKIEIFLLHPEQPTRDIATAMSLKDSAVWHCMIGNKKKWKNDVLTQRHGKDSITVSYHDRDQNLIKFEWPSDNTFADVINSIGATPLPPYLNRKAESEDTHRYQTVYSKNDGAVAAPTAGLHFTPSILDQIKSNGVELEYLTLHVSAGTFKPVEATDYRDHDMHTEQIVVSKKSIENLLENHGNLIAVGTTSLRILESLYWYGIILKTNENAPFFINKDLPGSFEEVLTITYAEALQQILSMMYQNQLEELHGETEIFIYPGYRIRSASGLFTNFHLPKSTLLLLVSAFTNQDWKKIYQEAIDNDYRFLSYGDSSLLLR
jgi:S-adenosylmethionine:tRNA ribosyltransferase-isomerase